MKRALILLCVLLCVAPHLLSAQTKLDKAFSDVTGTNDAALPADSVVDRSFVMPNGEKILRFEVVLDTSLQAAWNAFADEREFATWAVAKAKIDLHQGGSVQTHYKKDSALGGPGTITMGIIHYLPMELLTYKIDLNDAFPEKCQNEDGNLQEVIQFRPLGHNRTKITASMIGWGTGKEWDDVYGKFAMGNRWTYQQLVKRFESGPRQWQ